MARGFDAYGSGTTDKISSAGFGNIPTQHTYAAWIWLHTAGNNGGGRLFDFGATSINGNINYQTTPSAILQATEKWSTANGTWSIVPPSTNQWVSFVYTYDGSSTANNPVIYLNGVSQTVTKTASPSGTFSNGSSNPFSIGNRSDNIRVIDGMIAEVGVWNAVLTASEALALGLGIPPFFVRNANLKFYVPMFGIGSGERDWGPSHVSQTVTGTANRNHAPTGFWMPTTPSAPGYRTSGSLALAQGASTAAIAASEKFQATAAALHPNAAAVIAGQEEFSEYLSLTAPANSAVLSGHAAALSFPGRAAIFDAAQGGLLGLADRAACELAAADTALYDVQITESV